MTRQPLRVAFAGLAHSHPAADAANVTVSGGRVVAVFDEDARAAADFAERFGGVATLSLGALAAESPDLIIATPRPDEAARVVRALAAIDAPVFVNKVVAATAGQLADWTDAVQGLRVGTSSVLRFAPALAALRDELLGAEILSIRLRVQHDAAGFRTAERLWQDDPELGGGILVTVGVHAWEILDVLRPGARILSGTGWVRCRAGSSYSEDAAGIDAVIDAGGTVVRVQLSVTGVPGPDAYGVEVVTSDGIRSLELDTTDANESLGFRGLVAALCEASAEGRVVAPWATARAVVENTVHAAQIARRTAGPGPDETWGSGEVPDAACDREAARPTAAAMPHEG